MLKLLIRLFFIWMCSFVRQSVLRTSYICLRQTCGNQINTNEIYIETGKHAYIQVLLKTDLVDCLPHPSHTPRMSIVDAWQLILPSTIYIWMCGGQRDMFDVYPCLLTATRSTLNDKSLQLIKLKESFLLWISTAKRISIDCMSIV